METVSIRYIVRDCEKARDFYTEMLGLKVEMNPAPGFALLSKGALRLFLNESGAGGAGQDMHDGTSPERGGWNRFQLEFEDLEAEVKRLRDAGANFRNDIVEGKGGKQILLQDPSGNLIELFESTR